MGLTFTVVKNTKTEVTFFVESRKDEKKQKNAGCTFCMKETEWLKKQSKNIGKYVNI